MLFLTHGIIAAVFAAIFSYEKKAWADSFFSAIITFLLCGTIGQLADSMELPLVWLNILLSITITGIFIENKKRGHICTFVGIVGFIAYVFTYLV